jgi:hypothetical protein
MRKGDAGTIDGLPRVLASAPEQPDALWRHATDRWNSDSPAPAAQSRKGKSWQVR